MNSVPMNQGPWLLQGGIQQYAWGDEAFLPRLLRLEQPSGPYAELWLGDHPVMPSQVVHGGEHLPLDQFLTREPQVLGQAVDNAGGLPYLLKILSAARPLSIQVHPSQEQAEQGYAREQAAGVPLTAKNRSYRDANHKPELLVALTPMYALAGFRSLDSLAAVMASLPELAELLPQVDGTRNGLRGLLSAYFALPTERVSNALQQLLTRLRQEVEAEGLTESDPRYWAVHAATELQGEGGAAAPDRGLLFVFLLNLVRLEPGQGIFVPAGMPHAYLRGSGVELMASSDNVLRCGLTPKFVDPVELLSIVEFRGAVPPVLEAAEGLQGGEQVYRTPAAEFELRRISLTPGADLACSASGAELLLVVPDASVDAGGVVARVTGSSGVVELSAGGCCMLADGAGYRVRAEVPLVCFRVTRPGAGGAKLFRGGAPRALAFGTSGLRGLVEDITDLEAYVNTRGFLDFALAVGDVAPGGRVALGGDLRPSTHSEERSIMAAVGRAIQDAGLAVDYVGRLPTPALTLYGITRAIPSIMVTGSHIPFDRNGIKFNRSSGEVLKGDEAWILTCVARVRGQQYGLPPEASMFDDEGMFREGFRPVMAEPSGVARDEYLARYRSLLPEGALAGQRVVVYEHSAVGRELLAELLRSLGAEVHPRGRAEGFVAIDTEALAPETLPELQSMVDEVAAAHGPVSAIVSTDGDSDRPLVLGIDGHGKVRFVSGDVLGMLVADYLGVEAVAVPVSATDAIEQYLGARGATVTRTRIGSPYVIAAMNGLQGGRVAGWEANGGFLLGSAHGEGSGALAALPTRDAFLPICAVLHAAARSGEGIVGLLQKLPSRFTAAGLLDGVPVIDSKALMACLTPSTPGAKAVVFTGFQPLVVDQNGQQHSADGEPAAELLRIARRLEKIFSPELGFAAIERIDFTDGVRMFFASGDIAHLRPSGNAPQLRIYAVAGTAERAQGIVSLGLQEPAGLLRQALALGRDDRFVAAVQANIALTERLFEIGEPAQVVGTVSGSAPAQAFWQTLLDHTRESFRARRAISFHEDLPVNQAFGILLLWQRIASELQAGDGALTAFVFGEGSRATPFTETDNGQKPALLSYVMAGQGHQRRPLTMVELALRYFAPVESYLRRSGFNGLVVKWGDEVQIPTCDLAGVDPRLAEADVVRFVSMRRMDEQTAANKDWVGVAADGSVTAFIPRRPLAAMEQLAERGLLERRGGELWGGVNLGSIALSRRLLDALLAEFREDVNNPNANRKQRPDLDPQLFTALTIALRADPAERDAAMTQACQESPAMAKLVEYMPDVLTRLRRAIDGLEQGDGSPVRILAMDFEDQYWGDIGQHRQMYDFYMALNDRGVSGRIARSLAGLTEARDQHGNLVVGKCRIGPGVVVRNSVLVDVVIEGDGLVESSVLVGTHCRNIRAQSAFDIFSTVDTLHLGDRAGSYRVVDAGTVAAQPGERLTTLFMPKGETLMRVHEETDLRDRGTNYDQPILGNALPFKEAHAIMSEAGPSEVTELREARRRKVVEGLHG